jgi:hypothetical protein
MKQPLAYETLALELIDNDPDSVDLRASTGGSVPGQLTPNPTSSPVRLRLGRGGATGGQRAIAPGAKKLLYMRCPRDESVLFQPGRKAGRGLHLRFLEGPSLFLVPRTCRAWLTDVGRPGLGSATLTIPINARIDNSFRPPHKFHFLV